MLLLLLLIKAVCWAPAKGVGVPLSKAGSAPQSPPHPQGAVAISLMYSLLLLLLAAAAVVAALPIPAPASADYFSCWCSIFLPCCLAAESKQSNKRFMSQNPCIVCLLKIRASTAPVRATTSPTQHTAAKNRFGSKERI
jgi:hypothetical protein